MKYIINLLKRIKLIINAVPKKTVHRNYYSY